MIEVLTAYIDGAEIEYRLTANENSKWQASNNACADWRQYDYRVKPKPREFWLNTMDNTIHDAHRPGGETSGLDSRWVKVREVVD